MVKKHYPSLNSKQLQELQNVVWTSKLGKEIKRAQVILLLSQKKQPKEITTITGYGRSQIFEIRKKYFQKGLKAIQEPPRKPKELLTKKQREEIIEVLKTKTPNQCDSIYQNEYWTTSILGDYIFRTYGVKYKSKTSIYIIFKQARFTYHKPGRVYGKRDEKEVETWKKATIPILKEVWQDKNTIILAEDEMLLSTQTTIQKIWLPQGEYPKIEVSTKKENRSIYGFFNLKTGKEHSFKAQKQNMYITRDILKEIRKIYPFQNLLLFWDGSGWHRGSEVQKFLQIDKRIKVIYFPRYAPEENPQEHIWKYGRDKVSHNRFIEDIDKATDEFVELLNKTTFNYSLLGFRSDARM